MRIWIYSFCWNEKDMLPFYLRHYSTFAEKIILFDDKSDDGTLEIASKCPLVEVRECPYSGLNDNENLCLSQEAYKEARGKADWVMWMDIDEIIYAPDIVETLKQCSEYDVASTDGYNMTGMGVPIDDGRQIYEIRRSGVRAPVYAKPVIFKPEADMKWTRGRHAVEGCDAKITPDPLFKLLHYRYMGWKYTEERNLRNYDRAGRSACAWSCSPEWKGEHSPVWADYAMLKAFNVI